MSDPLESTFQLGNEEQFERLHANLKPQDTAVYFAEDPKWQTMAHQGWYRHKSICLPLRMATNRASNQNRGATHMRHLRARNRRRFEACELGFENLPSEKGSFGSFQRVPRLWPRDIVVAEVRCAAWYPMFRRGCV
jgi:hypothetical protein